MPKTYEDTAVFLRQLKWETATNKCSDVYTICIDCYGFKFKRPLQKQEQYELLEYMETLNMANEHSIVNVAIWLYQHEIPFRLAFQYNPDCSLIHNWRKRKRPKAIFKCLEKQKDAVMAYDLTTSPYGKKED